MFAKKGELAQRVVEVVKIQVGKTVADLTLCWEAELDGL